MTFFTDTNEELKLSDLPPIDPTEHYYPYRNGWIIRKGDKAFCGYEYDGMPYKGRDGSVMAPENPCIVCEDLVSCA